MGYLFTGPAIVVLAAFLLYPIGYSLWLSFHEWNGYASRWGPFVGVANYLALARDEVFWKALRDHPVPLLEAAIRQLRDRALMRLREGETGDRLKDLVA